MTTMTGSLAANFHEGSRSEYLAQFVFASFGTAVPVPHQEDTGIDLYCTLTERVGGRAWPRAYFSVQVKSTMDPWVFQGAESVRWLVEHPLPVFLCVVDKRSTRLRLYQTAARFYVWSLPPLPKSLRLVPTADQNGKCTQWTGNTDFSLSAPVIDASIEQLLDDDFRRKTATVLRFWTDIEECNLARIRGGIHSFTMPSEYTTNSAEVRGWATQGITNAPDLTAALEHAKTSLAYLSSQFHRRGDVAAATRCAMLLRHLFKEDVSGLTHDPQLHLELNRLIAGGKDYMFKGVDALNEWLDQQLTTNSAATSLDLGAG